MSYDFKKQKAQGMLGELALDHHFRHIFMLRPATDAEQLRGIDRWFTLGGDELPMPVEYKTDLIAHRTRNAFIETHHSSRGAQSGWAYTSQAHVLVYYVPGAEAEMAYWILFSRLRECLPGWLPRYSLRSVRNVGYDTIGLLVPLHELEGIALAVYSI